MNIFFSGGIYWKFFGKNLGPSLFTWLTLLELVDSFRRKVIGLALSKGADSKLRSLEASLNEVVLRSVGMWKWIWWIEMWKYVKSRIVWDQMMIFLFEENDVRSWILRKKHHTWTCRCSKIVESPSWMMGQCFEAQDAIIKSCSMSWSHEVWTDRTEARWGWTRYPFAWFGTKWPTLTNWMKDVWSLVIEMF